MMKRLLFTLLLLAGTAFAQDQLPAPVQWCNNTAFPTLSCTMGQNVASGHIVIVGADIANNGVMGTPTDTRATTWTLIDSDTSETEFAYTWIGVLASSGSETVTISGGTPSNQSISVSEWPASIGSTVDAHTHGGYSGTPATITTNSITTTTNGDLFYAYVGSHAGVAPYPNPPLLGLTSISGTDGHADGYEFSGTNGSYHAVFAGAGADAGGYVIFALKPSAISIATATLPTAALGQSYSYSLQAVGGAGGYTWSLASGSLPGGLSLSSGGVISGTPSGPTTIPTFQVTDGTHTAAAPLTATVNSSVSTVGFIRSGIMGTGVGSGSVPMGAVSAGQLIAVAYSGQNGIQGTPPTDTISTPFRIVANKIFTAVSGGGNPYSLQIWAGIAPSSTASDTITAIPNPGGGNAAAALFSNAQAFFDVTGSTAGNNTGSATLSGPSLTTLTPNSEVWAAVTGYGGDSTWNAGSGFTLESLANNTGSPVNGEHGVQATAGTITPQFAQTANANGAWIMQALAVRPTTSGPVSGQYRHKGWIF